MFNRTRSWNLKNLVSLVFCREDLHFRISLNTIVLSALFWRGWNWFCASLLLRLHNLPYKEDEFQERNGILPWVYECLLGTIACWVFQLLGWVSPGHVRFEQAKLNVRLKEHQDISNNLWEKVFFGLVWSEKSHLILYFVFKAQQVLSFLHLEKVHLFLVILGVSWDHDSFSLLFLANCLR